MIVDLFHDAEAFVKTHYPGELDEVHRLISEHGEDNNYQTYSQKRLMTSFAFDNVYTAYYNGIIVGVLILSDINVREMKVDTCVANKVYKNLEVYTFLWIKAIELSKEYTKSLLDLGGIYVNPSPKTKYYNITRFKERLGGKVIRKELYFGNPLYVIARKIMRFCKRKGIIK